MVFDVADISQMQAMHPRGAGRQPHATADELAESLVRHASQHPGLRCYLLLDPTLRDGVAELQRRPDVSGGCAALEAVPVRLAPGDIDKTHWPVLLELDVGRSFGSRLLAASCAMALEDWEADSLREGNGHRVGGWLFSTAAAAQMAVQLAGACIHSRAPGRRTLLRLYDPAVLSLAWPVMNATQQGALMGNIDAWFVLQRSGRLVAHRGKPANGDAKAFPPLSSAQWSRLDHIGPLNRALYRLPAAPAERLVTDTAVALLRADACGFTHPDDLEAFAWRALMVSPTFDRHPSVVPRVRARNPGQTFGSVTADMSEEEWSVIAMELNGESQ